MPFVEAVRLALQTIRAQKLKSAFSIIGAFIGVNTFRLRQFPDVQLGNVTDSTWRVWRRRPRVTYEDAQAVARGVTIPVLAAWEASTRAALTAGREQAKDVQVTAATELYFDIRSLRLELGRAFTAQEVEAGVPVLVLGHELADKLFEGQDPIGREVKLFELPYRVIGVVEKQGNLFGLSLDKFVVAPASAPLKHYVNQPHVVDAVAIKARSQPEMREAMAQAEAVMRSRRHLRPREPDDFTLETADEVLDFWGKISRRMSRRRAPSAPARSASANRSAPGGATSCGSSWSRPRRWRPWAPRAASPSGSASPPPWRRRRRSPPPSRPGRSSWGWCWAPASASSRAYIRRAVRRASTRSPRCGTRHDRPVRRGRYRPGLAARQQGASRADHPRRRHRRNGRDGDRRDDQRDQPERVEHLRVHRPAHLPGMALLPARGERLGRLRRIEPMAAQPGDHRGRGGPDRPAALRSLRHAARRELRDRGVWRPAARVHRGVGAVGAMGGGERRRRQSRTHLHAAGGRGQ